MKWYENKFRRHLLDMHIEDWSDEFLSKFSAEAYFENLKKANIESAMIYLQSHVGLCYYPTKVGKLHKGFIGKEDAIKRLIDKCRESGIAVTGYYSLIFNNWAHDTHPEWRMIDENGTSKRENGRMKALQCAGENLWRAGLCCPNNKEYRAFVAEQIKEMAEYFDVDAMFYDMTFWPHFCYCDSCKERWAKEVGGDLPATEDWTDPLWLLHAEKRRQWMGEFAAFVTAETKKHNPNISVEDNVANAALPDAKRGLAEEVLAESDFAGGDLYGDIYSHSFVCKFYRNATKNQPFENMVSRCYPTLASHTLTKSDDVLASAIMTTAAHHGATLFIDAIDPVGTMDAGVYEKLGKIYGKHKEYEKYFEGDLIEDIGIYYSLRSKFNAHGEDYCNHSAVVNTVKSMIKNHISCGVCGSFNSFNNYQIMIAPELTEEDKKDYDRIVKYVENGGQLYISGADCEGLISKFFKASVLGRTKERKVYIAPNEKANASFDHFSAEYPMPFDGTAPIVDGIATDKVIATITLPYTHQDTVKFASIHSDPPGVPTDYPAVAVTNYGKGRVIWSALPIEEINHYSYSRALLGLINEFFEFEPTLKSDADVDIEITGFKGTNGIYVNAVLLNEEYKARKVSDFEVSVRCDCIPKAVLTLPTESAIPFEYKDGFVTFKVNGLEIFCMFKIIF